MNQISFRVENRKLVQVLRNGAHAAWLEQGYHKPTGLHAKGYTFWSGLINGKEISALTLTAVKAKN